MAKAMPFLVVVYSRGESARRWFAGGGTPPLQILNNLSATIALLVLHKKHGWIIYLLYTIYKLRNLCYTECAKLIEYCKIGIIFSYGKGISFLSYSKSEFEKCKFRFEYVVIPILQRLVWRLSEFAFLCARFGGRIF